MNYIQVVAMGTELKIHHLLVMRIMDNCVKGIPTNGELDLLNIYNICWISKFIYLGLEANVYFQKERSLNLILL